MNTTTKTNRKVIVLSWIVAIVACAVFAWAIYYAPVPVPAGTLKLPEGKQPVEHRGALKPRAVKVAKLSEKMKAEQAQRTLPSRLCRAIGGAVGNVGEEKFKEPAFAISKNG